MFTDSDRVWVLLGKKKTGEASAAELRELSELLRAQDISAELIDSLWESRLQEMAEPPFYLSGWKRILSKIDSNRQLKVYRLTPWRKWIVAASVLLVIACLAAYYLQTVYTPATGRPGKKDNQFVTREGSKSKLDLPDGTKVWLNESSSLSYSHDAFGVQLREIFLSGEAFFDVTRNEKVPFVIHTGPVTITVKGTAFNVKAYPGQKTVETALVRGVIEITTKHDPDRKIILKPDEKIVIPVYDQTPDSKNQMQQTSDQTVYSITSLHKGKSDVIPETVWIQNKLEFDDEPFSELAPKMEEWFNVSVRFTDEEIRDKRFTGVIEKETLRETLKAMQMSYPFTYQLNGKQLNISK